MTKPAPFSLLACHLRSERDIWQKSAPQVKRLAPSLHYTVQLVADLVRPL
jgi:hypothetical protein